MKAETRFITVLLVFSLSLFNLLATTSHAQTSNGKILLSVQQFEGIGGASALAATVSELVRNELVRSGRLAVLEETGRLYRIQRRSVRWRDLFSESGLRQLGELLESRYVLTGSVSTPGKTVILAARIVDGETGRVLAAETVEHTGGVSTISAGAALLARRVLAYFPLAGRVIEVRGDTLIADIGLDDGVLPGQELTVADLETGERGLESKRVRSARYRAEHPRQSRCSLIPLLENSTRWFEVGATVLSPAGADELLASSRRGEEISELQHQGFGAVSITSDPPGALAIVSGLDVGRTPVKVPQLAAGRHELLLGLEGYEQVWDSILAVPGEIIDYDYKMNLRTGRFTIVTSQPDVSLRVDTLELKLDGTATVTLEDFQAGEHHISVRKPGYQTWRRKVEVDLSADSVLHIELDPHPGSVLVTSSPPGAMVFLNGTFLGKTTPWRMVRLQPGPHVVRAVIPGHGTAVDTVTVVPGQDIDLELVLREGWFGYIPAAMALVPAETLVHRDSARVDSFYLDIHEVTNRQYALFVEASERKAPRHWKKGVFTSGEENHPVTGVSFEDAAAFAAWCGKRLPTELEWELAAMGPEVRRYPWGDSYRPGAANTWSEGLGETTKVGEYPDDISPYGIYDMAGNVAEWVDSWNDQQQLYRVFRGGSFYVNQQEPSLYSRDGLYPVSSNNYTGFRCARGIRVRH